jgi:hypothetical protein
MISPASRTGTRMTEVVTVNRMGLFDLLTVMTLKAIEGPLDFLQVEITKDFRFYVGLMILDRLRAI